MSRRRGNWSTERVNSLLALRAIGVEWPEIKAAINKLPGLPIVSSQAVASKYFKVKAALESAGIDSRGMIPADTRAAAAEISSAAGRGFLDVSSLNSPPISKGSEALFGPDGAIFVSYEQARKWAVREGLCHRRAGLNLVAINAVRVEVGLFKLAIIGAE